MLRLKSALSMADDGAEATPERCIGSSAWFCDLFR